jgi:NTE family protein
MSAIAPNSRPAIVLSGGGVRGAYEVGVIAGLVEVLGLGASERAPFRVFAGTSVGAINAAYLASHADRSDLAIGGLEALWRGLCLDSHLRVEFAQHVWGLRRLPWIARRAERNYGWCLLDPRPLAALVTNGVDWTQLRANTASGAVHALIVAALNIGSGRTTMFAELGPGAEFRPSRDPLRAYATSQIHAEHVLASAALPLLFPARRIGDAYYCDGGLRFNTPIAPAIRAGADRLVIIPVLKETRSTELAQQRVVEYPKLTFLAGKLLNALLADPLQYDLQILNRFNRLVDVLEDALEPHELARVDAVTAETRGAPYRRLSTLVIRPTQDIGLMAGDYIRSERPGTRLPGLEGWLFRYARKRTQVREADWASYVLFDGEFADQLIALGKRDAHAKADEIRAFFAAP